jgi:triphosphoribosyl-dephospho-CoA synthetase
MDEENSQHLENSFSPKPINVRYNKRATMKETRMNGLHFDTNGRS